MTGRGAGGGRPAPRGPGRGWRAMPTALRAALVQALHALPRATPGTWDASVMLKLRTCAALGAALARTRSRGAHDADVARVVLATYVYLLDTLVAAARALHESHVYWQSIEFSTRRAGVLWLQSTYMSLMQRFPSAWRQRPGPPCATSTARSTPWPA